MALSISTNTLSLSTQRSMRTHDTEQAKLVERLSSGMRINRASDDAAGQAITSRLTSNLRGVSQALRSLSDATSMLQVADGAMASVTDTLQRLREMAVAAGNGSYTDGDRNALQKETQALLQHITQVGTDTSFNGQALFSQDTVSIGAAVRRRRC
jgi:flagellin